MHLVLVGAHPDDETMASGTASKWVRAGHRVTIVVATRGGKGHWKIPSSELCRIRTSEMEAAAKVLGADLMWLEFEDASIPAGDELREAMVDAIRVLKPDIILTFHPLVWRDDHRRVGLAVSDATLKASLPLHVTPYPWHRPEPKVYFFGDPMIHVEPDEYVDISQVMDIKRKAFEQHQSQWQSWEVDGSISPNNVERVWAWFTDRLKKNGSAKGIEYVEAFISRCTGQPKLDLLPII